MSLRKKSAFISLLRGLGRILPGDYLKTFVYLNLIQGPRKLFRLLLHTFYRQEHVYEVLQEFSKTYEGRFSVLEFGVATGYAMTKKLYATRYLKLEDRVVVHGFDSFEGLPKPDYEVDRDLVADDSWQEGQYATSYEKLEAYCRSKYRNYRLHNGRFDQTLTDELLETLRGDLPILIWVDCDLYASAKSIFDRLIPYIPTGCVIYFDDYEYNFGSRFTGESRVVHEINTGKFGDGIELIPDLRLSLDSKCVYRFINTRCPQQYKRFTPLNVLEELHERSDDSPLP